MDVNFQRQTPLCVIVVSENESRDIRISLNVVRSTQIFNEIDKKRFSFISMRYKIKMLKNRFQ